MFTIELRVLVLVIMSSFQIIVVLLIYKLITDLLYYQFNIAIKF